MENEKQLQNLHQATFEQLKRTNEFGADCWSARQLQIVLQYNSWDKFLNVIGKAQEACRNAGHKPQDHFVHTGKMVGIGSGAQREVQDVQLSRYACYLVVQNADPSKPIVAFGQTYFAVQTRKQELLENEEYNSLKTEEEKRLFLRGEMKTHNKHLASAARDAGVVKPLDYAIFQDHGYRGLYGGLGQTDIHRRKGLKPAQKILDHMGSTELAANLFRATQTEDKLRRESVKGKDQANQVHLEVGKKVRQTIKELGGTMPENLPAVKSIKEIESQYKKDQRKKKQLPGKETK
ncbi:MAG: DNA damage-inducible protein D [Candidatus Omnitrophica bacterium]|nr:DNA damage-inducible protein D [Candidatus Omnitrophota bacterium]